MGELVNLITAAVLLSGAEAADPAAEAFAKMGFRTQVIAEATLLITGAEQTFEDHFGAEIIFAPSGIMAFRGGPDPDLSRDLPLDRLDPDLAKAVLMAGFQAQIDFGPTSFTAAAPLQEKRMTILSAAVILKDGGDTDEANRAFAGLGFEVQTISPGVLLLTADIGVFEKGFGQKVTLGDKGAFASGSGGETRQLSPDALPDMLREQVSEAEFESPPDFGPTNF